RSSGRRRSRMMVSRLRVRSTSRIRSRTRAGSSCVRGRGQGTMCRGAELTGGEGHKKVAAGANPMGLKRGIEQAVTAVVDDLKKQSTEISGKEDIARVATISSREREIGDVIA